MANLLKNGLIALGFLFSLVLLVLGLQELRSVLTGAEAVATPVNVEATGITSNSATITFSTEKKTSALISYGTTPENLTLFTAEPEQANDHAATLSFLSPNTTYYYTIKIGDKTYDNNGTPYSFTTKPAPTEAGTVGAQLDNLDPDVFKQKFGTSDSEYDLNRDGIVNSTDYLLYLKKTQE